MSSRFEIRETPLKDLRCILHDPIGDKRGYLERMFCSLELQKLLQGKCLEQVNRTFTKKCGAVRGLHFQRAPYAEVKFVSCLRGEVFDVAIDIRAGSSTFLKWYSEILTPDNHKTLVIPEGFAHGFQTLTEDCEMLYFHTKPYHAASEDGLNANDPRLAIPWPLKITELSERDQAHPRIDKNFKGIAL
jgi:dTDP-4-dehydrorhamnose 3,5-epimerase